ncbi:type IX secretion system sortase PorU [uncultured Flavobacterium sp.]|uniref:type IX secretion system sortase PorU n=1 Tax=uncultured Flavobacterium sp. TaxID=165435 RepID=UPI0030ED47BD|tara:strand:- start:70424 stop:74287 length:3864 start_codon:yes stop_codon:yes gene_type:complete
MKKKFFTVLVLFLFSITIFAQNKEAVKIEWKRSDYSILEKQYVFPSFQEKFYDVDIVHKKLFFKSNFISSSSSTIKLIDFKTEVISERDLYDLEKNKLETKINFQTTFSKAREDFYISYSFNPIYIENGIIRRVVSFEYEIVNSQRNYINNNFTQNIENSVLATGDWYRFYVEKSGVYKVSKGFLESLGFNTNVDPRNIRIYGNGGRMVPLLNSTSYPMDLEENAIQFIGEEDGNFSSQDYILFYAEGTDTWSAENRTHLNLYQEKSYYYVTSSLGTGKRIQESIQPTGTPTLNFAVFDDYKFYEKDLFNPGKIGRKWLGDQFGVDNEKTFEFSIPNIVTSSPVKLYANLASASYGNSNFQVQVNQQTVGNISFTSLANVDFVSAVENFIETTFNTSSPNIAVKLTYSNGGVPASRGYVDYIILEAKRNLTGYGNQFIFRNLEEESNIGIGQYTISNASSISQVWDVSDIYNAKKYSNNQTNFSYKVNLGQSKKYIAVDTNDYFNPLKESNSKVVNQNLKGTIFNSTQGVFEDIDYVIITPSFLYNQAEKLANFHRNYSGLKVRTVTLESIYQEFSSGKQDVAAIRNFVKYIYGNASTVQNRVKYVNLFGDASFDYKNRIPNNTNIVPVFHGLNPNANMVNNTSNYSILTTFMSDDFFGLMDDNEGQMLPNGNEGIDIAVGRMVVSTTQEADDVVNKVIHYHDEKSYGRWRNSYVILTDDADTASDATLQSGLNTMIDNLNANYPYINAKKIHTDAYVQEVSAGGNRYPKAKQDFVDAIELGALVVDYYGHGGEYGFAQERIYEISEAINLSNYNNLPLFITMTCDFSRFDNPYLQTGGEFTFWNPEGGAISLVTTTRLIFVPVASTMNDNFNFYLYPDANNNQVSVGEALRLAKNDNTSDNRRVVFNIGDPALMLAIPKPKVVLTKINGVDVSQPTDVLNALSYVTLTGEVRNANDNLLSSYNGDLAVQIFDKNIQRQTLGNDGVVNGSGNLIKMDFTTLGETIFRGNASVVNGKFEFGFVVPKDIKIAEGTGKVSFYAKSTNPTLQDQTGHDFSIKIGGINLNAPEDTTPPTVRLYMNDESFVYGGITNDSPIFLAFLEDEHGINTASGIGHDIVAILDGDELNPYVLNDYYETELDNYQKGKVRFPFRDLEPGLHTITFKAWDVYNNLITAEIQFIVVGNDDITLSNVLNYPNPFVSYTEFWFNHNRPFEMLDVQVQIFTITGKVVKTINQSVLTEGFLSREIKWDGRDDFGDKIGKGVYVYKLTVVSTIDGKKSEKHEKLVIL